MIKLTNVDFIVLYLYAHKGRARRCDIMRAASEWRAAQGKDPLAPIYFSRYKSQSPFYEFDAKRSEFKRESSGMGRSTPDAKVSMWKLSPRGVLHGAHLIDVITQRAMHSICSGW